MSRNIDNRTQVEKQKEFDTLIFKMLELIDNIPDMTSGEYREGCDTLLDLRKMFLATKQQLVNTVVFETMIRRRVRKVNDSRYLSEMEKIYDEEYCRCNHCSSMVKNTYMKIHIKSKKCVMNHEAKFQTKKIGKIGDKRIANRMIYASTFKFNIVNFGLLSIKQILSSCELYKIIMPDLLEIINDWEEDDLEINIKKQLWTLTTNGGLDWFKDTDGKWKENGKV